MRSGHRSAAPMACERPDGSADALAASRPAEPSSSGGRGLKVVERTALSWGQLMRPTPKAVLALSPLRAEVVRQW